MSEVNNPLFENQKEFLERQKQEYKNALLNDVSELKNQSQKVGKTLLIAGGALAGVWVVSSLFRGKKKDKTHKRLKAKNAPLLLPTTAHTTAYEADEVVLPDGSLNYDQALHQERPQVHNTYASDQAYARPHEPSVVENIAQAFFQSDMAKALTQQLTAFLLVYLSKKAVEYLHVSKNDDIAASKEPETKDIDFSYHEEDAV